MLGGSSGSISLRSTEPFGLGHPGDDPGRSARPRLLDLFCKAGGAAAGYHATGFTVVGIDRDWQPNYPFFMRRETLFDSDEHAFVCWLRENFDAVHASPPCQKHSDLARRNGNADAHPCFIEATRRILRRSGLPFVIENVEGAPLVEPVRLCGTLFPELRVIRHRLFETNWPLWAPKCAAHPLCFTMDKRKAHYGKLDEMTAFVQVTGGGNCSVAAARDAMRIDWMTKAELNEAIPPAYTRFIGRQLLQFLRESRHSPAGPSQQAVSVHEWRGAAGERHSPTLTPYNPNLHEEASGK